MQGTTTETESSATMTGDPSTENAAELVSPFVVGARVAVQHGRSDEYTGGFIEKVYKNGNFTLRGDTSKPPRQWRPSHYRGYGEGRPIQWSVRWEAAHGRDDVARP